MCSYFTDNYRFYYQLKKKMLYRINGQLQLYSQLLAEIHAKS